MMFFSPAVSKESGDKKKDKKESSLVIRNRIGSYLKKNKHVLIYFYSDTIRDSLDDLNRVQNVAAAAKAVALAVDVDKYPDLREAYDVQYAPTLLLLRHDAGLSDTWVVDFPDADIKRSLAARRPQDPQKKISAATAAGKPQLLFFAAPWCGYCRKITPDIDRFARDFGKSVAVTRINIDNYGSVSEPYMIQGVPIILIIDSNGVAAARTGYPSGYNDYISLFGQIGVKLNMSAPEKSTPKPSGA